MVDKDPRRRGMRTGCAMGAALFLLSPMAEAQVSGATCNLQEGSGVFGTAVLVWVDGERTEVRIGERGLTREIAFSPRELLDWMRREFAGGDPNIRVGFNDCTGSQTAPLSEPPETDEDDPPPPTIDPPPPPIAPSTGNDSPRGGTPLRDLRPLPDAVLPVNFQIPTNSVIEPSIAGYDDMVVGDGWDELFA